jgi:hypothetical protein
MKLLIRPVFHYRLKTAACFPLNLRPSLFMLQCNKWLDLEAAELARLYATVRLFVNFFQPSFKLAGKQREGARVRKRYHPPATPAQRLLTDPRTSEDVRLRIKACQATLDPVHLLSEMRSAQRRLVEIAD